MKTAIPCSHHPCARTTTDPSGTCHDHRAGTSAMTSPSALPQPSSSAAGPRVRTLPGKIIEEEWPESSGCPSASTAGNPTIIRYREDSGVILEEEWREGGKTSRTEGPAKVFRNFDGETTREEWWSRDSRHRDDGGPAVTVYQIGGTVEEEEWFSNGVLHRVGAPAQVSYRENGSIYLESWSVNGVTSRIEGPARYFVTVSETASNPGFLLAGKGYSDHPALLAALRELPDDVVAEHVRSSIFGSLVEEGRDPARIVDGIGEGVKTIEGMQEYLEGAPAEWIRAYESDVR